MSFELHRIQESKREFRQRLAARPIAEKLAMLDALRARALAIRPVKSASDAGVLRIKGTDLPWAEVDAWRKELHRDFERALAETKLPDRPD